MQVLLTRGLVGLQSHRCAHVAVAVVPPWDELRVIEESWSGMRAALEDMVATSARYSARHPNADPPFLPTQLKRLVRAVKSNCSRCCLQRLAGLACTSPVTGSLPQSCGNNALCVVL